MTHKPAPPAYGHPLSSSHANIPLHHWQQSTHPRLHESVSVRTIVKHESTLHQTISNIGRSDSKRRGPFTTSVLDAKASLYLIREHDHYGEYPKLYAKIIYDPDESDKKIGIVLFDTGCGTIHDPADDDDDDSEAIKDEAQCKDEIVTLRSFLRDTLNPDENLPYAVILSHCHYDHILGLGHLMDIHDPSWPIPLPEHDKNRSPMYTRSSADQQQQILDTEKAVAEGKVRRHRSGPGPGLRPGQPSTEHKPGQPSPSSSGSSPISTISPSQSRAHKRRGPPGLVSIAVSGRTTSFFTPYSHLQRHSLCPKHNLTAPRYLPFVNRFAGPTPTPLSLPFPRSGSQQYAETNDDIKTSLSLLQTPGHTPDSLAVYDAKAKRLFVGDTLYEKVNGNSDDKDEPPMPTIFVRGSSLRDWWRSMRMLLAFVRGRNEEFDREGSGGLEKEEEGECEGEGAGEWVLVHKPESRRVRLSAAHVTVDVDAEECLVEMMGFVRDILDGKVPSCEVEGSDDNEEQVRLWDWALGENAEKIGRFSVRAPVGVMEKGREELGDTRILEVGGQWHESWTCSKNS